MPQCALSATLRMAGLITFHVLILVLLPEGLRAQKLSKSIQGSPLTRVYKLTEHEAGLFAAGRRDLAMLHTPVDSFSRSEIYKKTLPPGHYLFVSASQQQLQYELHAVQNLNIFFINQADKLSFALSDAQGNLVTNAQVTTTGGRDIRFDTKRQLYRSSRVPQQPVIRAKYAGQTNFFVFERQERQQQRWHWLRKVVYSRPLVYTWRPLKNLVTGRRFGSRPSRPASPKFAGYLAFNKPLFKPGDTLRWKAFVTSKRGRGIQAQPATLVFKPYGKPEQVIDTIQPLRPGSYNGVVNLAPLKLTLDRGYSLELRDAPGNRMVSRDFRYEAYELKSMQFNVRSDRTVQSPGRPIALYMKATDENELAVADGRVELVITSGMVQRYMTDRAFVPETLWRKKLVLDPVGETKLLLPDSIFPQVDMPFQVAFGFRNSNNESRSAHRGFSYQAQHTMIDAKFDRDSIRFDYLVNGQSKPAAAMLFRSLPNGDEVDSMAVRLPYATRFDPRFGTYEVTAAGISADVDVEDYSPDLSVAATQLRDSVRVSAKNPRGIPVWYSVYAGRSRIWSSYSTRLDTIFRHKGSRPLLVRANFQWGEHERQVEGRSAVQKNLLNVSLEAPQDVYPGQTVEMKVKVEDAEDRPVPHADLTAQAYTSKFTASATWLPYFGSRRIPVHKKPRTVEGESIDQTRAMVPLDWAALGKRFGLDTVEYYRFLYPKEVYQLAEPDKDSTTSVLPFLVRDGAIDPVSLVSIDGIPVYFSQADQLQRYAFRVEPGRHRFELRSSRFKASFEADIRFGHRHVFSIEACVDNKQASVVPVVSRISEAEENLLSPYMLRIRNNFESEKTLLKDDDDNHWLLNPPETSKDELLVGPVKSNYLTFFRPSLTMPFLKERGFSYTFSAGLIRQKSAPLFDGVYGILHSQPQAGNADFRQEVLKKGTIDNLWNEYLDLRSRTTNLFPNSERYEAGRGVLSLELDTALTNHRPYLKSLVFYRYDEPDFVRILPGGQTSFGRWKPGVYRVLFLLKDNSYYMAEGVVIKGNGQNHYRLKALRLHRPDAMSIRIDSLLKSQGIGPRPTTARQNVSVAIAEEFNNQHIDPGTFKFRMTGTVISKEDGQPLVAARVQVKGLSQGVSTGLNGTFSIGVPARGKLRLSFIGYETEEVDIKPGAHVRIVMEPSHSALQEVVVVGYGGETRKQNLTSFIAGAAPGLSIRGRAGAASADPLVIVDGLPFNGKPGDINQADIAEVTVLKDQDAVAVYGSRAANGVVIIRRKVQAGNQALPPQGSGLRKNFSDVGFWKPDLVTDKNGESRFKVTFPDDITSWNAQVLAMTGRRQTGQMQTTIRSFKTLSANFVSPQFAVRGDTMQVMGKVMNYTPTTEQLTRTLLVNGTPRLSGQLTVRNAWLDSLQVPVNNIDSLRFRYTLEKTNGYTDGEERLVPVMEAGVTETSGNFAMLGADSSLVWKFDPAKGPVYWHATASVFPVLLDELKQIRLYPYDCNEQLASKLKALLLEKQLKALLNEKFLFEKDIPKIIERLEKNRLPQGLWSWWPNGRAEMWITTHVADALLKAEAQQYAINLDKKQLIAYLAEQMTGLEAGQRGHALELLQILDPKYVLKDWLARETAAQLKTPQQLYDRLKLARLWQLQGSPPDLRQLLSQKKETMFGGIYWGEESYRFFDNSVQTTLLVYQILRTAGQYPNELARIRQYFLEQRRDGKWRNTYESALILQTILPDLLALPNVKSAPALRLNDKPVTAFPASGTLQPDVAVSVSKTGALPVYFTAYQQFRNPQPAAVAKDFRVTTELRQKGAVVKHLEAGQQATLRVTVTARADADYVMIDVPIPAGCSYDDKTINYGRETHREYFKEKTSIFCDKLKQGTYTFEIKLMPRYQGSYVLNPAKAEMMYFPVFYGREGMKRIPVK